MEIANIRDLKFKYRGCEASALDGIDLSVKSGELVLLCGPSGGGKTTLLRCLKPALRPAGELEGSVSLLGSDTDELSERTLASHIGYVGQSPEAMIVTDTVLHELAFTAENLGLSEDETARRIGETAEFFGLSDILEQSCDTLSGGQKQLLALAAASVCVPELLLLDEPLSQLDPVSAHSFISAVVRLNKELGVAIIICEHRLEELFSYSDRVVMLKNGRIAADLPPRDFCSAAGDLGFALPAPARIWQALPDEYPCPINTSQGRDWLSDKLKSCKANKLDIIETKKTDPAVTLKKLSFRFDKNGKDILKDLSAEIGKGEIFGIIGGNGAGKSTLLSLICGTKKPYMGKITLSAGETALLPQDPRMLFVSSKLMDDLSQASPLDTEQKRLAAAENALEAVGLSGFGHRHPLDLSGGEQQLAALAKLLVSERDILLLDEPTKGTDPLFKAMIASLLRRLAAEGKTIILVSHDIEFCASVCSRCSMLFGGRLIGTDVPQRFFSGESYYTTSASRMSRGLIENAVTAEDVIKALGGKVTPPPTPTPSKRGNTPPEPGPKPEKPASKAPGKVFKGISFLALAAAVCLCSGLFGSVFKQGSFVPYIVLAAAAVVFVFAISGGRRLARQQPDKPSGAVVYYIFAFIIVPATLLLSAKYINSGKYLFVSLLVLFETMAPFYLSFERRRAPAREAVTIAVLTAMAVAGRAAFFMLPQFKPVLAVVILSGCVFGPEAGFLVGSISMLISNTMFGQGPWTP